MISCSLPDRLEVLSDSALETDKDRYLLSLGALSIRLKCWLVHSLGRLEKT